MAGSKVARFLRQAARASCALAAGLLPLGDAAARTAPARPQPTRPNVVVILLDDVGFSDIGAFGSEIPTPNIDALAKGGLRFTQFYNSARCSPSRASLLTGTYPHQAGLGHLEGVVAPNGQGLQGRLSNRVVTMAEVAGSAGYYTAMAGKWHLGLDKGAPPWARGFQHSFAMPWGELYYKNQPQPGTRNAYIDGRRVPITSPEVGQGDWYGSDLFVQWQARFIDQARSERRPFFLYMPFVAAHFPLMAPPEDVARFKGRYMQGWEPLRRARLARQKQLGIVARDTQLPPALPDSYDWDKLTAQDKDRFDTLMAVYAAVISRVDRAIGDLVEKLRASGELDNTLILFLSDNGGNGESGPDGRLNGRAAPGSAQSVVWAGMNWAALQNTPFQYFKHFTAEGGIATPLIAHWPRGIAPRLRGTLVATPGHLIDVMPTLIELSGATYPRTYRGNRIVPMQGRSMVPAFRGASLTRAAPLFWEHEGNRAVRDGRWKLVARFQQPWQLFDMNVDRTEQHDLAGSQPERVAHMAGQWDAWAAASYVDPWRETYDHNQTGARRDWGGFGEPQRPYARKQ